ncbi:septum formation family protein [Plantactinospora sp. WMMB782]|uniref:septum formation family protein n=1 Tax=Plantactinospora sp. WMMB782 TaxID=3404121 RepID=UPI003B950888
MSEVAITSLRELAGPDLYRRNAFRITGLPVDVDRRAARARQQQLTAALRVGADVGWQGPSATADEVRAAFDVLGDPRRRLVHEVFAVWGAPDGCECPAGVHHDHDNAVRAHTAALDIEPDDLLAATMAGALPGQWTAAATAWTKTLRSASFWRHLHHRVRQLDDRQLDDSAVETLRAELPLTLVRPLSRLAASAAYPAPLRKHLDQWPVPARERDRLLEEAAEPLYTELESTVRDLHGRLDSGDPDEVVAELRERVNPLLARLEGLTPRDQHRRTEAARDKVAVLLNNCALARNRSTGQYEDKVKNWLTEAAKLATDPETKRRVRENLRGFDEAEKALDQFRRTVDEIRRTRGRYEAASFLRGLLPEVTDEALAAAIREMLADLDAGAPISYRAPSRPSGLRAPVRLHEWEKQEARRRRRAVGVVVLCVVVLVGLVWIMNAAIGGEDTVDIHPAAYGNVSTEIVCVRDRNDWRDGDTTVTSVPCGQDHAAEVIAYLGLREANLSWPAADYDYLAGLARFSCGEQANHFGLTSGSTYTTEVILPDRDVIHSSDSASNYATCLVMRTDVERWSFLAASQQTGAQRPVQRPLTSQKGRDHNAPVGYCVRGRQEPDRAENVWPIVRCDEPHWAEILGYEILRWPPPDGATLRTQLVEEANRTCRKLATELQVPDTYSVLPVVSEWWTEQSQERMYAACVAHREDHQPFYGRVR